MDSVVYIILTKTYSELITLTTLGARAGTWRAPRVIDIGGSVET